MIDRSDALKDFLLSMYNNKLWDRPVSFSKDRSFIYISSRNEFRRIVHQPSGDVSVLVGFMLLPINKFMWV